MDRIKVQIGTVQMNKTSRFVKPCLRLYGEDFIKKLNSIYKLAYGVGDMFINKEYSQHIFILIDTKKCISHWITALEWVRQQEYYEDDYAFDDLITGRLHMLVIKLPDEIDLESFWQGKYSKMYKDEKMIDLLDDETKSIVIKDANYKVKFIEKLRKQFTTNIQLSELNPDAELEIPPTIDEEQIF